MPSGEAEFPSSQDMTFGDLTQSHSFTYESVVDQTLFAGDGLVAQPNKVWIILCNKVIVDTWREGWRTNPANNSPCLKVTTVKLRFLKLIFPLICENECHDLRNLWDSACNPAHKNYSLPVSKFTLIFFTAGSENWHWLCQNC